MDTKISFKTFLPPLLGVLVIGGIAFAYSQAQISPTVTDAGTGTGTVPVAATNEQVAVTSSAEATQAGTASGYKDGTYTASAPYMTPEGSETVSVTLTVANGIVTDASVTENVTIRDSRRYVDMFMAGYKQQVVGKSLASLKLSRVSGSSLTSAGFNAAVEKIRSEAAV